jgi:hypothetical protein
LTRYVVSNTQFPFKIESRKVLEGGIELLFIHRNCGEKVTLFIKDSDELKERYPVVCPCGKKAKLYFGNPKVGRKLMDRMKEPMPEDEFDAASEPSQN